MNVFTRELKSGLVWLPEIGMGRFPVPKDRPYDDSYFSRYQKMADTPMGHALTKARIELVGRHYTGPVLDVGIGAGQFVEARAETKGYDVNPAGVHWLVAHGYWKQLYDSCHPALTFWDSLEHIDHPELAISQAEQWVFVSVPIFDSADHILLSRHYRKDEHIWYWTHDGLIRWFAQHGFRCIEHNSVECELGREGIGSYAFRRS
ncbi:phage protein [Hafnia paralvei ATCC 29927]|uniref:methyltransferase domain-containing protein n=1 Tax=Hafnia paralvei TaxID=546367 RepID=UPI0007E3E54E|nr:methyltransferase domain-containing protein [Hafnia paralvei]OAT41373.1 phage protein [Hafnia paralvei ATCC 29927]